MIRLAEESDLPQLLELRTEAEEWRASKNVDQWVPAWRERIEKLMTKRVEERKTWIKVDDEGICWTLSFDGPDLDFWTEEDDLDSALYMYKFIVARRCAGQGTEALGWALRCAHSQSKKSLRIDFHINNDRLARYYET